MRALHAPLSPNEELTLRRIARSSTAILLPGAVMRLARLSLIEAHGSGYRLTSLGWQRYQALPQAARRAGVAETDDFARMLSAFRPHRLEE
jgi:hypothetical protein